MQLAYLEGYSHKIYILFITHKCKDTQLSWQTARVVVLQIKITSQTKEDMGIATSAQKHLSPTKDMQRAQQANSLFFFSG